MARRRAGEVAERDRVDADRCPERGHAARDRLDHRQAEALRLGRDDDGVGGIDPVGHLVGRDAPEGSRRTSLGRLPRAVEALQRPGRVVREEEVAAVGVEPESLSGLGLGMGGIARGRCPPAAPRRGGSRAGAGQVLAELARDRGGQRGERQRGARDPVRARVEEVVAVSVTTTGPRWASERRPRDESEVRVHDVEAVAPVPPPKLDGRRGIRAEPGREVEQLHLDVVAPTERVDLVPHEVPNSGRPGSGTCS